MECSCACTHQAKRQHTTTPTSKHSSLRVYNWQQYVFFEFFVVLMAMLLILLFTLLTVDCNRQQFLQPLRVLPHSLPFYSCHAIILWRTEAQKQQTNNEARAATNTHSTTQWLSSLGIYLNTSSNCNIRRTSSRRLYGTLNCHCRQCVCITIIIS